MPNNQSITTRDGHLAVNVKTYGMTFASVAGETDHLREIAYNTIESQFWQDADALAEECGFGGVYSEGRMGGWCVPFAVGGDYPNPISKKEQRRFLKFQRGTKAMLAEVPKRFVDLLCELIADKQAEFDTRQQQIREFCQQM